VRLNTTALTAGIIHWQPRNIKKMVLNVNELELTQKQMTQRPMLRAEVYARALRASQNHKEDTF